MTHGASCCYPASWPARLWRCEVQPRSGTERHAAVATQMRNQHRQELSNNAFACEGGRRALAGSMWCLEQRLNGHRWPVTRLMRRASRHWDWSSKADVYIRLFWQSKICMQSKIQLGCYSKLSYGLGRFQDIEIKETQSWHREHKAKQTNRKLQPFQPMMTICWWFITYCLYRLCFISVVHKVQVKNSLYV